MTRVGFTPHYGKYLKTVRIPADEFGRSSTNPPAVVDQGNVTLYAFKVDTDKMTYKLPVPSDYAGGAMGFVLIWTNDGDVDDDGKAAKWQIDYQVSGEGDVIDGDHANSPKSFEDTYIGAVGWVEHHTGAMTIGASDFAGKFCILLKISAVTPTGAALTCDPHLLGLCFSYNAKNII